MLNVLTSKADRPSELFIREERRKGEGNLDWFERTLKTLSAQKGVRGAACLVLLGGKEETDFHLRVAQGHVRHDMSPSHFSHVALLQGSGWTRRGALWEISLQPQAGFGYPPAENAIQSGSLKSYASADRYPNLAVMRLPVRVSVLKNTLTDFKKQRSELDCVQLTLAWLAWVWGAGRAGNPLLEGTGIPSAAFIEALVSSAGFDLTPGLASRSSCPEAIWQAAKWWHKFYEADQREPIHGMWHLEHRLV